MYFVYCGYQHGDNEVQLKRFHIEPRHDRRGVWRTTLRTLHISGTIKGTSQNDLKSKIEQFHNAYSVDNGDAIFYQDNGQATIYALDNAQALGGIRLVWVSYPTLDEPGQYATGVNFEVVMQAEYAATNQSSYMMFSETVEFIGNTGPLYEYTPRVFGRVERELIYERTPQRIIQSGQALGLLGWPLIPDPLYPAIEDQNQRRISRTGPHQAGPNLAYTHYMQSWMYHMTSPDNLITSTFPNYR